VGAAKASYGDSIIHYAVFIRLITPTQAIIIDRYMYSIHYTILA
jgi:hypothetical protein